MTHSRLTMTPTRVVTIATILLAIALSWIPQLDTIAEEHIETGLQRSLVSYATARALNAVISAAQGTETAFQPVGVGITLTPGQLLDPLNDLVEKFSKLMLLASVAFGAHKILLTIGSEVAISVAVTLIGLLWLACRIFRATVPPILSNFLLILLIVRFAVPVMVVSSDMLFAHFMEDAYRGSQQELANSVEGLPELGGEDVKATAPAEDTPPQPGFLDSIGVPKVNMPSNPVASIKQELADSVRHIIDVMVIFVLHVLVFPILALWIMYRSMQKLIEPGRFRVAGSEEP